MDIKESDGGKLVIMLLSELLEMQRELGRLEGENTVLRERVKDLIEQIDSEPVTAPTLPFYPTGVPYTYPATTTTPIPSWSGSTPGTSGVFSPSTGTYTVWNSTTSASAPSAHMWSPSEEGTTPE